jgi:hypothetical protein
MNMSQKQKKMPFEDEWGRDPSVQSMRRVFSSIEAAQQELLLCLNISFLDPRLRRSREQALELFERAWHLAVRRGVMKEKDAALLYVHCLARTLRLVGVEVPEELLPRDEKVIRFLQKELP